MLRTYFVKQGNIIRKGIFSTFGNMMNLKFEKILDFFLFIDYLSYLFLYTPKNP